MATKSVKIEGTFKLQDAAGVVSPNKVLKDLDLTVTQVQISDPITITGSTTNYVIPFGEINAAKRIYLKTDQPVTLKIGLITETGFQWQGAGILSSGSTGIAGLWITTGPTDTNVEVVIAGD